MCSAMSGWRVHGVSWCAVLSAPWFVSRSFPVSPAASPLGPLSNPPRAERDKCVRTMYHCARHRSQLHHVYCHNRDCCIRIADIHKDACFLDGELKYVRMASDLHFGGGVFGLSRYATNLVRQSILEAESGEFVVAQRTFERAAKLA